MNQDVSATEFCLRPALIGHYVTSARSEADAGYDRNRGRTDIDCRRACRSGISKGGIGQTAAPTAAERGSSVSFSG
jgi:hypothetical protein